jgi:DNA repair protein RecN (Recombination protein N)
VSGVTALDAPGRVRELARMLGGMAESGTAQAHAQELLETAEQERAAGTGQQTARQADRPARRGRTRTPGEVTA